MEGGRGQAPVDCAASRDTWVCSSGKELSVGHRMGSPAGLPLTHTLPRGLSVDHEHSLLDKTLKALSLWKPEECENKEEGTGEPFTGCLSDSRSSLGEGASTHCFSLAKTRHAVPHSDSWRKMVHILKTQIFSFFPQCIYLTSRSPPPPQAPAMEC